MLKESCKLLLKKFKSKLNDHLNNFQESCCNLFIICAHLLLIFCSYARNKLEEIQNMEQQEPAPQPPPPAAPAPANGQPPPQLGVQNFNQNDNELALLQAEVMDVLDADYSDISDISDVSDVEDDVDDDDGDVGDDDDVDNEILEDTDSEMPESSESEDHTDSEDDQQNDEQMIVDKKLPQLIRISDIIFASNNNKTLEETFINSKPTYQFKPLQLKRDRFLNKSSTNGVPIARSGHRIIADDANLYSLGGYNPRSALTAARDGRCMLFQELWRYNFATKRWKILMNFESMPQMPRELASNALVMYKNVLISHGGTGYPFGESCSNDCYAFSTRDSKPWLQRLRVTGELPTPLYGPAMVVHDDYLYTIGGTTGFDYACDVFRLNLKTRVWENLYNSRPEMRDDPEGRYRHEIVYDGKYIYVLGGGTSLNVFDLQRIPAFNLQTNRWEFFDTLPDRSLIKEAMAIDDEALPEQLAGFPKPRKCFTCVQHKMDNGDIEAFVTGGLQGDFSTYFADVWKLNIRTLQWTLIRTANLPKALYFHSAADTGHGQMYIFGGIEYDEKDMRRRNRVYKMWMTIPKLSEICWDAITYYNEQLGMYEPQKLLSLGIPKRFVDRIEFLPRMRRFPQIGQCVGGPSGAANAGDTEGAPSQSSFACTTL